MALVPINLPPGCFKNGTRYMAAGRWYETNLCRWHNGALRPIGGWERRTDENGDDLPALVSDPATEQVRDGFAWRANDKSIMVTWGTNLGLLVMRESGAIDEITPAGLPPGDLNPSERTGYGSGTYGSGFYGSSEQDGEYTVSAVARWKFDTWGQNLLALADWTGTIYQWEYGFAPLEVATPLVGAPTDLVDFIVTDQRIVMGIGSATELRTIRWSDSENASDWTPTQLNQAGSFVLQGSGQMIGIYNVQKQVLILTETDAHVGRYLGPPYIYGFDRVGEGCEPVHRSAVVTTDKFAIWFGRQNIWLFDGTLQVVPCDILDFIKDTLSDDMWSKVVSFTNADFTEVWWLYPSTDGNGENDSYILYDWRDGTWAHGYMDRSAAIDRVPTDTMLMTDTAGIIWRHELQFREFENDGIRVHAAYATTGPLELNNGERNLAVRYIYPDSKTYGELQFLFEGRQMPTDQEPVIHGVYQYNNPISTIGLMGRELMLAVQGKNADWAFGGVRLEVAVVTGTR